MNHSLHTDLDAQIRQEILSKCLWSETHSSLKDIIRRGANPLPLVVSFADPTDAHANQNGHDPQALLFFDRAVSNKISFTPLQASEEHENQFEVCPPHCTFAFTDQFRGVFEFVRDGQRCSRIFTNLERLVDFTTRNPCMVVFMSRDRLKGHILDPVGATWSVKKYCQGAIFRAQRINRSSDAANEQHKSSSDHLECLDEYNYSVFLNMNEPGRFSLITTLTDQRQSQPELFLHNTQTPNIGSLIKRLAPSNHSTETNRACIRLVRGSVPHNFHCQYLRFIRQHAHDVLVGLTQQGLIIEWNLDSDTPCRYATNLNEILSELSLTWDEQLLENYIDRARANYRDNFRSNFQLTSTKDWAAFYQYWKWTGDIRPTGEQSAHIPYQSRHRFHVIASIQDLSDNAETLPAALNEDAMEPQHHSQSASRKHERKILTHTQRLFLSQMTKLLPSPVHQKKNRVSLPAPRTSNVLPVNNEQPFDDSIYESNPGNQLASMTPKPKPSSRRTQ